MEYKDVIEMALGVAVLAHAIRLHVAGTVRADTGWGQEIFAFVATFVGVLLVCLGIF